MKISPLYRDSERVYAIYNDVGDLISTHDTLPDAKDAAMAICDSVQIGASPLDGLTTTERAEPAARWLFAACVFAVLVLVLT